MFVIFCGGFRLPNFDAAASRVLNNGKAFSQLGHEVLFISWGGSYRESDLGEDGNYYIDGMRYIITQEIDNKGLTVNRVKSIIRRGKRSLDTIDKLKTKPDLIILYNAFRGWSVKMMRYCNNRNIRLANDITEWYNRNDLYWFMWISYWYNMNFTQKKIKNKILISKYLLNYYEGTNNILIPPLCDLYDSKWNRTITDLRLSAFKGITLIYAGTPGKKDDVHTVINVVSRLLFKDYKIRLLLLGFDYASYVELNKTKLISQNFHPNIIFLGKVSQDLVPAYYKNADFMVLLRKANKKNTAGFPTKFVEAFCSGIPVITNNTSDLSDYVKDGMTGFLSDDNSFASLYKTLVEKVLPLSQNKIKLMKEAVIKERTSFHYQTYISRFEVFLNNLK